MTIDLATRLLDEAPGAIIATEIAWKAVAGRHRGGEESPVERSLSPSR